ncbi:MAG: hypothetical protein GY898_10845 [Proteobacteria bacterium]|nr:hypothetical protein [Pseudomonadota bacterium]
MRIMFKTCLAAALLAGTTATQACNEVVLIIPDFTVTDAFVQDPAEKVDILLVVDNSCSMLAEQDKLSEEFEAFTEFFLVADTDFHIGITTTDMEVEAGRLVGDPPIITRTTPDPAAVFRENVLVGAEGSGFEKGIQAAWSALSPTLTSGPNAGFYREEAALSVIFVSDEDDGSNYPVHQWLDAFWDLKGQRNRDMFTASALTGVHEVTNQPAPCGETGEDPFEGARDAPRYWELVNETHGVIRSICGDDFNGLVGDIGLAVSGLRDRFYLSQEPRDPTALEVIIFLPGTADFNGDGTELPPEGIDGEYLWVYETAADDHWIRFIDTDVLPPIGARMTVTYEGR